MSISTPTVRTASHADVALVVQIHNATFPGFFLTSLGPRFLASFYRGLLDAPQGVLLVSEMDDDIVGFVGGATDEAEFFTWLMASRKRQFIQAASLAAIRRPTAIGRLLRARRRDADAEHSSCSAALLSIGVDPAFTNQGFGRGLAEAFAAHLSVLGIGRYCLTTDAQDNDVANAFYRSLGMRLVRTFTTREGRIMNEYASLPSLTEYS